MVTLPPLSKISLPVPACLLPAAPLSSKRHYRDKMTNALSSFAGDCQVFPVIYGEVGSAMEDPRDLQVLHSCSWSCKLVDC